MRVVTEGITAVFHWSLTELVSPLFNPLPAYYPLLLMHPVPL
jgi:hypothetical protein